MEPVVKKSKAQLIREFVLRCKIENSIFRAIIKEAALTTPAHRSKRCDAEKVHLHRRYYKFVKPTKK
jgi:hypothetical protein